MKSFVKWFDESPLWLKIIFALPIIDIVWAIYRIVKGAAYGKVWTLVGGILWLVLGWGILWLIDIICVIGWKHIKVLA